MPPNVNRLTPFEKRLRRCFRLRQLGHEPTASNCFWAKPEDFIAGKKMCQPCAEIRKKFPGVELG